MSIRFLLLLVLSYALGACANFDTNVMLPRPPVAGTTVRDIEGATLGVAQSVQKEYIMFYSVHTNKTSVPSASSTVPIQLTTSAPVFESSFTIPPGTYGITGGINVRGRHLRTLTLNYAPRGRIVVPLGDDGAIVPPLYFFQQSSAMGGMVSFDPSMTKPGGIQTTMGTWTVMPADAHFSYVDAPLPDRVTTLNYVYKGLDSGRLVFLEDVSQEAFRRENSGTTFTTPAAPGQYRFGQDTVQINQFDANSVNFTVIN